MGLANSKNSSNLFYLSRSEIFLAKYHHDPELNQAKCESVSYWILLLLGTIWVFCEDAQVNYFYPVRTILLMRCKQTGEVAHSWS